MQVQKTNNISFGGLFHGDTINEAFKVKASKKFKTDLRKIEYLIRKNDLHKQPNVDILLHYSKDIGFYGIISSKKQGVPMCMGYTCKLDESPNAIKKFTDWVNAWNDLYSPQTLNRNKMIEDAILAKISKSKKN